MTKVGAADLDGEDSRHAVGRPRADPQLRAPEQFVAAVYRDLKGAK